MALVLLDFSVKQKIVTRTEIVMDTEPQIEDSWSFSALLIYCLCL